MHWLPRDPKGRRQIDDRHTRKPLVHLSSFRPIPSKVHLLRVVYWVSWRNSAGEREREKATDLVFPPSLWPTRKLIYSWPLTCLDSPWLAVILFREQTRRVISKFLSLRSTQLQIIIIATTRYLLVFCFIRVPRHSNKSETRNRFRSGCLYVQRRVLIDSEKCRRPVAQSSIRKWWAKVYQPWCWSNWLARIRGNRSRSDSSPGRSAPASSASNIARLSGKGSSRIIGD